MTWWLLYPLTLTWKEATVHTITTLTTHPAFGSHCGESQVTCSGAAAAVLQNNAVIMSVVE